MPTNEDGEFELILGNRQLLSVFFIVAILLGVFFAMGYIVGRNSSPVSSTADGRKPDVTKQIVVDSNRPSPTGSPAAQEQTPAAAAKTSDQPSAPPQQAEKAPSPATKPSPAETKAAAAETGAASVPEEPQSGQTYLQVAAVARAEAELFVDVLSKKGFHSLFAPVPEKAGMFRVLVGPFKDAGSIAQARTDLQKAGFKGFDALVRKY